ncbi:hypothetical protein PSHT_00335 [Puccinia striiformis]|uniref:Uncharacterized protein n=1 Tax=Puccinia striiformis TaxID=27350 RepID=A0A2S4WNG9_9BASI|nr:hypothetical protein PSHT_00335 [Puccinia striiformis]
MLRTEGIKACGDSGPTLPNFIRRGARIVESQENLVAHSEIRTLSASQQIRSQPHNAVELAGENIDERNAHNLNAVKKLTSEEQLFYMANRIVVGRDSQSVNSANKFILGIMEGPARLLSVVNATRERGMVLRILENTGNEANLNKSDWVLLLEVGREALVVAALSGKKKGIPLTIKRLIYHIVRQGERSEGDQIQYPVAAAFAVEERNVDCSRFPTVLKI